MPYSTCNRRRRWRNRLALIAACAAFPLLAAAAPSSATVELFCPAGGGTIGLGAAGRASDGCTNSVVNYLLEIIYYNAGGVSHCAVGKASPDPEGRSSNVTAAVCGYGLAGSGDVHSLSSGVWGYARGTNSEPFSVSGYWGQKRY
ncbi:hypothetical protein [Conexibacter sp. CPCC 206217]|uniref:hypothetical protein n=1 Tax=Conexibacter sp. CPCC 206217 TaxID=3064574 RepID=UPI00271EF69B|nr:hypothetical protein [Conexibacter sp. CPCC 206217]MDO8211331.1 hypothetical protein [Conexibacter sp. CPCC 206217]